MIIGETIALKDKILKTQINGEKVVDLSRADENK
jgi:hypothetical protein